MRQKARADDRLVDAFVFGSSVRGKRKPNDIDICLILKDDRERHAIDLVAEYADLDHAIQATVITASEFIRAEKTIVKTILEEGTSLLDNTGFLERTGMQRYALFSYDSADLSNSDRVRLHYALRGRNSTGFLKTHDVKVLADGMLLGDIHKHDVIEAFLQSWDLPYESRIITGTKLISLTKESE